VCGSRMKMKMNEREKSKVTQTRFEGFEMKHHIFVYVHICLNTRIWKMSERHSYILHFYDSSGTFRKFKFRNFRKHILQKSEPVRTLF
jgi:hypothetical protein